MVKKIQLFAVSFLVILVLSLTFTGAITGAMGNARMTLYPEVNGWTNTILEETILVRNVNAIPINVTLEVDENSTDFLELIDDSYLLQPDTEEKAKFIIRVKKEGIYNGKINVFFKNPTNEKEAGVALVSQITIIAKKDQEYEEIDDEENEYQEDENQGNSTITGNIIQDIKDIEMNPATMMVGSSLLLLVILLILLSVMAKKNKKKRRKINGKKKT